MRPCLPMLLALLAGCSPHIAAWPPPAALPTAIDPVDEGRIELGGGANALLLVGEEDVYPMANIYQGAFGGSLSFGVGHDIDVRLTGSRHAQGTTGDLTGTWWPVRKPFLDVGLSVGLAGSEATTSGTVETDEVGEDGKPITREVTWSYGTIAPTLGGRVVLRPIKALGFPFSVRASHSWAVMNNPPYELPRQLWLEASTGVLLYPSRDFSIGLGIGAITTGEGLETGTVIPVASLSISGQFDAPKKSTDD